MRDKEQTYQDVKKIMGEVAVQTKVEPLESSLPPCWLLKFRIEATLEQVYHLRRFLHLNHQVSILVQHTQQSLKALGDKPKTLDDIDKYSDTSIAAIFFITYREEQEVSKSLYNSRILETNPQYTNTIHHNVTKQEWDLYKVKEEAKEIQLTTGDSVAITGSIEGYTRTQVEQMLKSVGINVSNTVTKYTKGLLKGQTTQRGTTKENDAAKHKVPIIEGKQLRYLMDQLSKAVFGSKENLIG